MLRLLCLGALAVGGVSIATSAAALTICLSPCVTLPGGGGGAIVEYPSFPILPPAGLIGIHLPADGPGLRLNLPGDLVIHVPGGLLEAPDIDLRAGERIDVLDAIMLKAADFISLCAEPLCVPHEGAVMPGTDPFRIFVAGPLTSGLALYAAGSILVTSAPVPEPGSAALVAIGLVGLIARRRGRHTR